MGRDMVRDYDLLNVFVSCGVRRKVGLRVHSFFHISYLTRETYRSVYLPAPQHINYEFRSTDKRIQENQSLQEFGPVNLRLVGSTYVPGPHFLS